MHMNWKYRSLRKRGSNVEALMDIGVHQLMKFFLYKQSHMRNYLVFGYTHISNERYIRKYTEPWQVYVRPMIHRAFLTIIYDTHLSLT